MKIFKISLILVTIVLISCSNNSNDNGINEFELDSKIELTENEISDLLFLREEEKLARDVYLHAYDVYKQIIFKNIANSEQSHMDNVLVLLDLYGINDPVIQETGKFTNKQLQKVYNDLIKQSNISLVEALKVGSTIEDMDIYDISQNEERTLKSEILAVYSLLKCGSRNHLRNFYKQVVQQSGYYTANYISNQEFEEIISTSNEFCGTN
ncbi:DUF2202 domain-containing protein [uncultured Lutibacter sp.]|uniref:DUF2202 domain-containing protein n=1 Tax=uncultured Lutibacter sp. TaxID=437739 RepID=UPI002637C6B5|nr:DUF2202 domain-containing protein [uncultured Lutibacter sp.]